MSRLLEGKRGLIFGLANNRSIAWGISEACHREGATLGFTYLNDALAKRVVPLAESLGAELIMQCDVQNDQQIDQVFSEVGRAWGKIDFLVHSLAYAQAEDLKNPFHQTSRDGFKLALDISAYSLIALARRAAPLMTDGGSIITLTYLGGEKVVPNYRLMGVAKAALEASVRELAADLGDKRIRVNALSAGPIRTLAASGIADFRDMLTAFEARAPLKRNVTIEDCGNSALWLLSDLSSAVSGETIFVDCGFHATAM
jgi:enoyl-[acyl-carrier protein] reductase I